MKLGVIAVQFQKFVVGAGFFYFAAFHYYNFIGALNGAEAVRNYNGSAALHQLFDGKADEFFGFGIYAGSGFVEDDDFGVVNHGAHKGNELPLPYRKCGAAFHYVVVQTTRQAFDKFPGSYEIGGFPHLGFGYVFVAQTNIVGDSTGEKENVLQNQTDVATEFVEVVFLQVVAVYGYGAFVYFVEAAEQINDGRFTRAGGSY